MAPDEPSGARPAPVVLRIKLRYDDVEAMVQRFAPNVGKSGLFLPTKSLQAVGAEVKFELRLADDTPVLVGLGRVKAAKAPDPANPKAAFGMAIELMRVTRESRDVIMKMLERRKVLGLAEVGIPMPSDIDAARRSEVVDTSVKDTTATAVPTHISMVDSAPVLTTQMSSTESGPVMTAPRRATGPLAVAKSHTVMPLAPEAPRKKRAPVHEVIERASGPVAMAVSVPGLDDDVDVGAVIARARALAGGDLDAELDALRESSAAPVEISIEAASAELARQLGGAAVRRDRSARWAPPPSSISTPIEVPVIDAPVVDAPTVEAEKVEETVDAAAFDAREATPIFDIEPDPEDDEEDSSAPAEPVEPEQIADEIHQLQEADYEEVEHTAIGGTPAAEPMSFDHHAFVTQPGDAAALERSLDQHLADAEAEADADDLGLAGDEEVDDFEILAEADAADDDLLAAHGEADASGVHELLAAPAPIEPEPEPEPGPEPEPEPEMDPVDEFADEYAHVPARVRARQRSSSQRAIVVAPAPVIPRFAEPPVRPSETDFASRLELSDEFESIPEAETVVPSLDEALGELDPRSVSAGHALAAFEDHERGASQFDEPAYDPPEEPDFDSESAFTVAGDISLDSIDFDAPPVDPPTGFPSLRAFDSSDVIEPRRPSERKPTEVPTYRHPKPPPAAADNYDLETALEALDVDLDDLSMPHAPTQLAAKPRAKREGVPKRAETDIPIDFDDFDDE